MNPFIQIIISQDSTIRNKSFASICKPYSPKELLTLFGELDTFRKQTPNLYERVRACIFLYSGFRYFLMDSGSFPSTGIISSEGFENLLKRNFEKAIHIFRTEILTTGPNANIFSCLAESYHQLTFQILADQVRKSVRSSKGNQWMFRVGRYDEHPLKIHPKMLEQSEESMLYPILREVTPVRMDLTHSGWSDIFFLGMDYPEGARVVNVSIDLGVFGRDEDIKPPLETYVRVIDEPVLRITALDLKDSKDITRLNDLFNFGNDYLSLLKAAIIASGTIPPSFEGTNQTIAEILGKIVAPGMGLELVTKVNDIPKGSRLAVSTNLLGSMISVLMRATQQTTNLEGELKEQERRLIASRAILGEWLGGSGGGWQDSGGIWPGVKAIEGTLAMEGDPEYNVSRGCLLPKHRVLTEKDLHPDFEKRLTSSLVLMHGGMASNVGPILEMVTEKYLLRQDDEWNARQLANEIYYHILDAIREGDIRNLAHYTNQNFNEPIKTIIPWATTHFTETIIKKTIETYGPQYWGFLMLGGMSGGGMGMFVDPGILEKAKTGILKILKNTKNEFSSALPFAMEPVVYNFQINKNGSVSKLLTDNEALMTAGYYAFHIPKIVRSNLQDFPEIRKIEIDRITLQSSSNNEAFSMLRSIVTNLFKFSSNVESAERIKQNSEAEKIRKENGFDYIQHEQIRNDLIKGRIGLSRNKLPAETIIEDVKPGEVSFLENIKDEDSQGEKALKNEAVAVICLAAGVGSRWTKGAGVIKAINPFVVINGKHRSFLEIHLAKNRKTGRKYDTTIPFIIATSYLTHKAIENTLQLNNSYNYPGKIYLSPGKSIGQRFVPMERDLRFLWEEMPQEQLDENKQKVREDLRSTLISWAKVKGEGNDYVDNIAEQRISPLGHWFEVANMLRNGTMARILREHPQTEHFLLHNVDTLGADIDPAALHYHIKSGNALTFEVIPRHIDDKGGGLAKINGKIRLLEGLAQPHENDELTLSYYNTLTTWISIDKLLAVFGLTRENIQNKTEEELAGSVRKIARKIPSYVTIKDVKYRWGHGQEDIYPVAQIEKLWGDMSSLPDVQCGYLVVPRKRGQQLKDPAQLDSWVNDGTCEYIMRMCEL